MVGMERTILPQLAEEKFGLIAKTTILSFLTGIVADNFGILSSVGLIAFLTIISAFIILIRMTKTK